MAGLKRAGFLAGASALGAASLAAPAAAAAPYGDAPLAGTVTLGVVAPFTGDAIRLGEQIGNGVRAAIDDTNQLRGLMQKAFQMRTFDDQNLLASGLVNAQFACDDGTVVCVIGHLNGRITDAALKTYVNNSMPLIVPASTYDGITSHGYGSVLRLATKDSTEGRLNARNVESLKPALAVVLYQDGDYGLDVAAGFHNQLLADKIASKAIVFSWSSPDFPAVAKQTVEAKPDVVFLAGLTKDMGGIMPALRSAGYAGPLFASQGFFDPLTTSAKLVEAAEGLVVSSSMPPLQLAPSDFRVRNNFESKYGPMTPLSTFAYAAAQIAIAAVNRTGASDRIGVARALSYATPFDTVLGSVIFQNDGDQQNPNVYFYTVKNGAWSYLHAWHRTDFILK